MTSLLSAPAQAQTRRLVLPIPITIDKNPAAVFLPFVAFGAALDGLEQGDVAQVYTPANIKAMADVGYGGLTYRLRTELAVEAWHWNPQGTWSEPDRARGYWTSSPEQLATQGFSNGYRLTHRGSTIDQAGDDGYSRLDDSNPHTYWKSNPYLDSHFTHESNALHPQWVVVDLGRPRKVNALHLRWGALYASHFRMDAWDAPDSRNDALDQTDEDDGRWRPFPRGTVTDGHGGTQTLHLCQSPITARFVRLWLTQAPARLPKAHQDIRDILGYSLCEIGVGTVDLHHHFRDLVQHAPGRTRQTVIYVSSTDPWHQESDRDVNVEQPSFGRILRSPLTHQQPLLVPVGVLYDIPDNAAALLRFLKTRRIPLRGVELGEEPDGQYVTPEDYGALYVQFAHALRAVDPAISLGGPSFQTDTNGWACWPDKQGNRSWVSRFLHYLAAHHDRQDFQFLSFEWYPFDNVCTPPGPSLRREPELLAQSLARLHREGLPNHFPLVISEYGYSSFAGQIEMEMPAALLNTEIAAQFLALGGTTSYLYGLEPNVPIHEASQCPTWGNLALFLSTQDRQIRQTLPAYWAEQMLTQEWAEPHTNKAHILYPAHVEPDRGGGNVMAYAVLRPDRQWAVLLIATDPARGLRVKVRFQSQSPGSLRGFAGPLSVIQYGPTQYAWHASKASGFASRDLPPSRRTLPAGAADSLFLPPYSLTVVRGRLASSHEMP